MKVLSNLFGNNTKINANNIALNDKNNKGYTLDNEKTILYNNSEGTNDDLTLEDNIENYRFYEIYFSRGAMVYSSLRMSTDFLSDVTLSVLQYLGNITRLYISNISISGTSLTRNYSRYLNIPDSGSINGGVTTDIMIYKIIGYK